MRNSNIGVTRTSFSTGLRNPLAHLTFTPRFTKETPMRRLVLATMAAASLFAAACTQTGNVERGAVGGALLGGAAGAVIGNNTGSGDAQQGAAIGAAIGAIGGAYSGCVRDGGCGAGQQRVNTREYYDQRSGRYYFRDPQSGRYFYENGEPYP